MIDDIIAEYILEVCGFLDSEGMPGMRQELGFERQQLFLDNAFCEIDNLDGFRGQLKCALRTGCGVHRVTPVINLLSL